MYDLLLSPAELNSLKRKVYHHPNEGNYGFYEALQECASLQLARALPDRQQIEREIITALQSMVTLMKRLGIDSIKLAQIE